MNEKPPSPGSKEAISQRCCCPILDNNHGAGFKYGVETVFWINEHCPLHGVSKEPEV